MDVTLRQGNRDKHEHQINVSMAGFGLTLEGPLNSKSTYLYSLSRSFLDFVISSAGLQAVPKYWTSQGKITYDLSSTQKFLSILLVVLMILIFKVRTIHNFEVQKMWLIHPGKQH